MAFQNLYCSRTKDYFKIMSSKSFKLISNFRSYYTCTISKIFFSGKSSPAFIMSLTLIIIEIYNILENVGLLLYLPYIMTHIFNFIIEEKKN